MGKRLSQLFWVLATALCLRACVFESVRITDDSMLPLLREGDVVFLSKLHYGIRVPGAGAIMAEWIAPKKGDLVVAVAIGDPPVSLLRRIVAVPGESVKAPDGKDLLLKDGEFYLAAEQKDGLDSRKLGPVNRKAIIGRASYLWVAKRPSSELSSRLESSQPSWRILQPL